MNLVKLNKKLNILYGGKVKAREEDGKRILEGELSDWSEIVAACTLASERYSTTHVVNDIKLTGTEIPRTRLPQVTDKSLEGRRPDVLIIGGGISGASIARELTRWKIDVLLVEKESDLACHASGRNDGEVHPGIDLGKGSLKQRYVVRGNAMYDRVCKELDVPFKRNGQYVGFTKGFLKPLVYLYALHRKSIGVKDTVILSKKELFRREPNLNPNFKFALFNPSAGCVSPYNLTIAYAENAVRNGAQVSLLTAVTGMDVENGKILAVHTNRGTVYPEVVVNAAGCFAEEVAAMAKDRFYSVHPRRGTNSILDKKAGFLVKGIAGIKGAKGTKNTKGGGILNTVHENLLVGPDAIETFERENFATEKESIEKVFAKQKQTAPTLSERDIITYFTGVRSPTFEEDFVIERGRKTRNLVHCAGIQSPGLTTAPAVAEDVAKLCVDILSEKGAVAVNDRFDPIRKGIPHLAAMPKEERQEYIRNNPDYGVIVCRCEEVSKGEILDALKSPICVPTVDGIKRRVRPGMGRCQGGFCQPLVTKIIAEFLAKELSEVRKNEENSVIVYSETKGRKGE